MRLVAQKLEELKWPEEKQQDAERLLLVAVRLRHAAVHPHVEERQPAADALQSAVQLLSDVKQHVAAEL